MAETPAGGARELRARFREAERESSRLRLIEAASRAVAAEREPRSAMRAVLGHAMNFLAVDAGAVMQHQAGGLVVQASQGPTLPVGARVPARGVLGAALKSPELREHGISQLRVGANASVALELLLPLRWRAEVRGLLVLSSARAVAKPDAPDIASLQALAVLLGCALEERAATGIARHARRDAAATIGRLTPREQQVLALLPRGLSNAEMAQELGIATGTVKIHVERILHKLGLRDRTQAAVRASEWGFRT
jgi:DNA-binding NarL/FixJ family response regulator